MRFGDFFVQWRVGAYESSAKIFCFAQMELGL